MSRLVGPQGQRKYLNELEVELFIKAAGEEAPEVEALCLTICYTGCRVSEALLLTPQNVDFEGQSLILRTLKRRGGKVAYRVVPVPRVLMEKLRPLVAASDGGPLFPWHRTTVWRRIKRVMEKIDIEGIRASGRGLRHSYGVRTQVKGAPLPVTQKWLGHSDIGSTLIYTDIGTDYDREICRRVWG